MSSPTPTTIRFDGAAETPAHRLSGWDSRFTPPASTAVLPSSVMVHTAYTHAPEPNHGINAPPISHNIIMHQRSLRCNQPTDDENLIEPRVNIDSTGDVITVARAVLRIPVLRAWYVAHHALCGSQRIRGLHAVLDPIQGRFHCRRRAGGSLLRLGVMAR